ncbi:hypothetical protein IJ21_36610 [Paenibacillus sp. 32O-W]|nr:hypothetical protein IJ21_36610 [Paenibacillus sp. 32O-W]
MKDIIINRTLDEIVGQELEHLGETLVREERKGSGSTDAGNVSHVVPTSHAYIKIGPADLVAHTPAFREAAASARGDEALITGAKALALAGLQLLENPELLAKVKEDFARTHR